MSAGADDREYREQWELVTAPCGAPWSGRARYAAAMFFHKRGEMGAETLEVYRICSRLDDEDPRRLIRERGADDGWLDRLERYLGDRSQRF